MSNRRKGRPHGTSNERQGIVRKYEVEIKFPAIEDSADGAGMAFRHSPKRWVVRKVVVEGFSRPEAAATAVETVRGEVLAGMKTVKRYGPVDLGGLRFVASTPKWIDKESETRIK